MVLTIKPFCVRKELGQAGRLEILQNSLYAGGKVRKTGQKRKAGKGS
jgi:hypothetical protein